MYNNLLGLAALFRF